MRELLSDGIEELIQNQPTGDAVYYITHQAVKKESTETTKMRIVYDCSAKSDNVKSSLRWLVWLI